MSDTKAKLEAALKPWLLKHSKESHAVDELRGIVRELWLDAVATRSEVPDIDPESDTEIE